MTNLSYPLKQEGRTVYDVDGKYAFQLMTGEYSVLTAGQEYDLMHGIITAMNATQGIGTKALKDGVLDEMIAFVDQISMDSDYCGVCGDSWETCEADVEIRCDGRIARDLIARLAPKGE